MRSRRLGLSAGFVLALSVSPAAAYASDAYWNQVCTNGGWGFNTCASAWVTATGNTITIRVWNLAGAPGSHTSPDIGFVAVGLRNIGSELVLKNLSASRPDGRSLTGWTLAQAAGGIPGPSDAKGAAATAGLSTGIFSQFGEPLLPRPKSATTDWTGPGQFGGGFVTIRYQTFQTVCTTRQEKRVCETVPVAVDLSHAVLALTLRDARTEATTGYECAATGSVGTDLAHPCVQLTTAPEPMTTTLVGTGLVGLGLVRWRSRRRTA